jgi:hypothetical protein
VWSVSAGTKASCRSPRGRCYDADSMSDHTERLKKISERISAAKEFL